MGAVLDDLLTAVSTPTKSPAHERLLLERKLQAGVAALDQKVKEFDKRANDLQAELKRDAASGQYSQKMLRAKAAGILMNRNAIETLTTIKTQFLGIRITVDTAQSMETLNKTLLDVTQQVAKMNGSLNLNSLQKLTMTLNRNAQALHTKSEVIGDTITDIHASAFDDQKEDTDDDDRISSLVASAIQEAQLATQSRLPDAPQRALVTPAPPPDGSKTESKQEPALHLSIGPKQEPPPDDCSNDSKRS